MTQDEAQKAFNNNRMVYVTFKGDTEVPVILSTFIKNVPYETTYTGVYIYTIDNNELINLRRVHKHHAGARRAVVKMMKSFNKKLQEFSKGL